jgi:uncharacterized SAM-binding protein YcdF (DUF218 family)
MLFLADVFSWLAAPLHWAIMLVIFALLTKSVSKKRVLFLAAGIILLLFSNKLVFNMVAGSWEKSPKADIELEKKYDFAIVPAYHLDYLPEAGISNFNEMPTEILKVIEMYEKNYIRRILVTGKTREIFSKDPSDAETLARILMDADIPERKIYIESESINLHENAQFSKALIDSVDDRTKNILITSAIRAKRAQACFYQERMDLDVYPVGHLGRSDSTKFYEFVVPNQRVLIDWGSLMKEILGFYSYSLFGYV